MVQLVLSERDFDYEIQALAASFFPGQRCNVVVDKEIGREKSEEAVASAGQVEDGNLLVAELLFGQKRIVISVSTGKYKRTCEASVSGVEDWHKREGKPVHPYRTQYKNVLKKLLFQMLSDIPKEELPEGLVRRIPLWGTMTGVRPTKIPMKELLQGRDKEQVRQELADCYCCSDEKVELCMDIALREAELLSRVDYQRGYSLYIGIPFCPTTCLYCSFPSYPFQQFGHLAEEYLAALLKELAFVAETCQGRELTSVYVGGGTPTTLTPDQLNRLFSFLETHFPINEKCEITVEAGRPDSITNEKLQVLLQHRAGRISINPQTMQPVTLKRIGREHTVKQTVEAFRLARELGFENINMDLIAGLPGETTEQFEDTLRQIKELSPDSLTVHSLVVKRASALRNVLESMGDFKAVEREREQVMEKMLAAAESFARAEGYQPYYMYRQKNSAGHAGSSGQENIGYARQGRECIYNVLIMEEKQDIIACGAGSVSKRVVAGKQFGRCENIKNVALYIERIDEMIERKRKFFAGQ